MKRSNKLLIGGFIFPIVVVLGFIVYMSVNSTPESEFQLGRTNGWHNVQIY